MDEISEPDAGAVVHALRQPGTPAELADEAAYLDAFDQLWTSARKPARTILISTRAAVAAGLAVLAAGTGAAAYTGSLPGPLQRAAHSVLGAPADDRNGDQVGDKGRGRASDEPTETPTGTPTESATGTPAAGSPSQSAVGPDATGPAAFGLCRAWSKGGLATTSVAYRTLATAAGSADGISAYCVAILGPGGSVTGGSPTAHPGNSSHPTGSPSAHPGNSSHPTGSPSAHPGNSSHPTGSPAAHAGH